MSLSLVAALGNPGREYEATRHNLGWWVIDLLAKKRGLTWKSHASLDAAVARWEFAPGSIRWLVKPLTFMNESGRAVGAVSRYYKIQPNEIVAVYDDVGLDLGRSKISETGSAGGHNGVKSLLEHLGGGFIRYRLGIGPKEPAEMDLADFVLGNFPPDQNALIQQKLDSYVTGLELLLERGPAQAMNELNRRETT